jgi:F-type H+-transporting ATPase subunit b
MDQLIDTFHIDWRLLIGQMINFTIVLAVLYFFAIKPLTKIMHERSAKIEEGLKNADEIEKNLADSEKKKQQEINEGRRQAQEIIGKAEEDADKVRAEKVEKTKSETKKIVTDAKQEIANERESMYKGLKTELGELVLLASNKIASDTIDEKAHAKLIESVIEDLKTAELK